ncbi:radical SAM protein, partial [Candidatus Bathyarchaeota archaeon]|nr:radical SAM protein [Candidatus Bathyarchaeota archaeon]
MNLLSYNNFWNAIIGLPTTKKMLEVSLKRCSSCNKTILEIALNDYVGKSEKCNSCRSFYSKIIRFWIEFLRLSLSIKREKVEKLLEDPYAKRAIITIVKSFLHFGIRKPLSIYAPFLVVWDFTHKCNLNCQHCYSNSGKALEEELNTKEAIEVVNQLADFGVTALAFSGGEPLIRSDFFEVAQHAVKRGLYVSVATNGTLLTKENVRKLKKAKINYVEISIDGASAQSHDSFRGVSGAFDNAIKGLRNCVQEDLCACIATTATKKNLKEIPAIIDLAEQIGAERFTYFNFVPTGRGKELYDQDISPEEREELMSYLLKRISNGCNVTILTTAPQLARLAIQCQGEGKEMAMSMAHMQTIKVSKKAVSLADFIGGCGAGRLYCSLSPKGDVHPCVFLPINVGNIKDKKFQEIWLNSKFFTSLRDRSKLKGPCSVCDFRNICGGCRARANAYHGNSFASDPGC